jgi:hypothetical protein
MLDNSQSASNLGSATKKKKTVRAEELEELLNELDNKEL